jgi:hypothetical protein
MSDEPEQTEADWLVALDQFPSQTTVTVAKADVRAILRQRDVYKARAERNAEQAELLQGDSQRYVRALERAQEPHDSSADASSSGDGRRHSIRDGRVVGDDVRPHHSRPDLHGPDQRLPDGWTNERGVVT